MNDATRYGAERICDACGSLHAGYNIRAALGPHPKNPKRDSLAVVISCTRTPPLLEDGSPNPDHEPGDVVPVAWMEERFDFCDRDCLANIIDAMWRNAERRRRRLWDQSPADQNHS